MLGILGRLYGFVLGKFHSQSASFALCVAKALVCAVAMTLQGVPLFLPLFPHPVSFILDFSFLEFAQTASFLVLARLCW